MDVCLIATLGVSARGVYMKLIFKLSKWVKQAFSLSTSGTHSIS